MQHMKSSELVTMVKRCLLINGQWPDVALLFILCKSFGKPEELDRIMNILEEGHLYGHQDLTYILGV